MRTEIFNDFAELGNYETDNGNSVVDKRGTHVFYIEVLESFNDCRRGFYQHNDVVVDGDIICHKEWFKYDNFLKTAFDKQSDAEDYEDEQRIKAEAHKQFSIYYDHRFYVVVRSYDGKDYAVNIHPDFYSEFVPNYQDLLHEKNGHLKQTIIPIDELDDNYVFALSNSFIMQRFLETTDEICHEQRSMNSSESLAKPYEIDSSELAGLRIIAFIDSLNRNGFSNIVFSVNGPRYTRDNLRTILWHTSTDHSNYQLVGQYYDKATGIVMCRPEIARKYEKNGFLLIDYDEMLKGNYVDNMPCKISNPVRSRTEKH